MFRIQLVLIAVGGFLAFSGFQEYKVSKGTTIEPADIELAAIEDGSADTSNAHIRIGSHYPAYFELIYWGEEDSEKIDYVYYPILSEKHPFVVKVDALFEKYPDGIPDKEIPELKNFSVLVKSSRYKTLDEIPEGFDPSRFIQGLAINKIASLKSDELELMKSSFPSFDQTKVVVLEQGRTPSGPTKQYGMMGGGGLLAILGLFWMIGGARSKE